ncbi:MAG TPA: hypothetical protein VIM41_08395 [Gammaproteobacteria bacterium]
MKKLLTFIILLHGCSVFAVDNPQPPSGEAVFDILLNNSNRPLSKEPLCNMKSGTRKNVDVTLGQHLATLLSVSYETKNIVSLTSSCALSKHDNSGVIVDAWDCKLEMNETNASGEFISSAMVAFTLSVDKSKFINGSLRCF